MIKFLDVIGCLIVVFFMASMDSANQIIPILGIGFGMLLMLVAYRIEKVGSAAT